MPEIDSKSLRSGGLILIFGQAFQAVVAFSVNLVLVRFLMPEEFGRFALIMAGATLAYNIISLRISALVIRVPESEFSPTIQERYFAALTLETILALIIVFGWLLATRSTTPLEMGLVLAIGFRHWVDSNKAFFERSMPYKRLGALETGVATIAHLLTLLLVLSGVGAVVLIIREIFITAASFLILHLIGGVTFLRLRWLGWGEFKNLLLEAKGIWLDGMLEGSYQQLTIILAGLLGSERIAGFFFQAQRLAIVPHQLLAPIGGRIMANWFSKTEGLDKKIAGRNRLLIYFSVPLSIGGLLAILFADPVVPLLFGDEWAHSATLLAGMGGLVVFMSLFEILKTYCWNTFQMPVLLRGRIAQYSGLIGLMLLSMTGVMAADIALAIGLSVSYCVAFVTVFSSLRHKERRLNMG